MRRQDWERAGLATLAAAAVTAGAYAGVSAADWLWLNHIITRGTP